MILQLNGADIGVIKVIKTTKPWHLRHIQIAPKFQARGLGTIALNRMLEEATIASAGVVLNVLRVNPAKNLYEALGFEIIKEDDTSYKMQWSPHASAS